MSYTDAQYRDRIRQLLDDGATSHRVAPDPLTEQVNGSRKAFLLSNRNVVEASLKVSSDGGSYTTTGLTVDDATMGLISLSTAPALNLEAVYFYQFFSDTEIDQFRDVGISKVGSDPTSETSRSGMTSGLFTAACHFSAADGCRVLADRFARLYPVTTGGGQSSQKNVVCERYMALADEYERTALKERADAWGNRWDSSTEAQDETVSASIPGGFFTPSR